MEEEEEEEATLEETGNENRKMLQSIVAKRNTFYDKMTSVVLKGIPRFPRNDRYTAGERLATHFSNATVDDSHCGEHPSVDSRMF